MAPQEAAELALLRQLFKNLPKCNDCERVATLQGSFVADDASDDEGETCAAAVVVYGCDDHPDSCNVDDKEELPYAAQVRALDPQTPKG